MVISSAGEVFACDSFRGRVIVFTSEGGPSRSFTKPGDNAFHPTGIAIGKDGLLYVADDGNHCVQVFNAAGNFQRRFGERGKKDGQFDIPLVITADQWGDLYVVDHVNHRIQVFSAEGTWKRTLG